MEKREYEEKKDENEVKKNVNRTNVDVFNINRRMMDTTMPFPPKRVNRNKRWGYVRFRGLRSTLNDKIPNVAEQTEASKKVLQLVAECKYSLTQVNGQRKFGPPLDWTGPPPPGPGYEIFVGKIPRTLYEHDIYPVFSTIGRIYEIRLMMDFSGMNRGYCFVMYTRQEDASRAVKELDHYEIRPGRRIGVVASINYCRLYINQIPSGIPADAVIKRIYKITDDVEKVAVYQSSNGSSHFALISYKTHRGAAMGRRRLVPEASTLFQGGKVNVEWAHPNFSPSNMFEECGTCDQDGNVKLMKSFIRSTEPKRTSVRRSSRKCGQTPRAMNETTPGNSKKIQKAMMQMPTRIISSRSAPSNFDRSTASSIPSANEQSSNRDHRATKTCDEQTWWNQMISETGQDPSGHNNAVEGIDYKKKIENIVQTYCDNINQQEEDRNSNPSTSTKPKIVDSRESSLEVGGVVPNPYRQHMFIEGSFDLGVHTRTPSNHSSNHSSKPDSIECNSLASNINPLAVSFGQQNGRLGATFSGHCNIEQSSIPNNPALNDRSTLNDVAEKDILLKLQAKTLFQAHSEPWQNGLVHSNSFYQSKGPLQPNCTLNGDSPCRNDPFYYNMCAPQLSTSTYPEQYYQDFQNVQDVDVYRMMLNNNLQKFYNMNKMSTPDAYNHLKDCNRSNRKDFKCPNSFDNHFDNNFASSTTPPVYYYQGPNQFFPGYQSDQNVFNEPKIHFERYSQARPRTPRPILNRTFVNGGYN